MVSLIFKPQRSISNFVPVKGDIIKKSSMKIKLFEEAVDYILTSRQIAKELLSEILGFSDTKCIGFYQLSIGSSVFGAKLITQSTIYFIYICYLRSLYLDNRYINKMIDKNFISQWIKEVIGFDLPKESFHYFDNMRIKNNEITFVKTCVYKDVIIKLEKFFKQAVFKYTQKPIKLNFNNHMFHNNIPQHENLLCLGVAKVWLEDRYKADKLTSLDRSIERCKAISQLKTFPVEEFDKVQLIDSIKRNKIILASNTIKNNFMLSCVNVVDHYAKVESFSYRLKNIVQIMEDNNINNTYHLVITSEHALSFSVVKEGNGYKFTFYDPNDIYGHKHVFMHNNDLTLDNYNFIIMGEYDYLKC